MKKKHLLGFLIIAMAIGIGFTSCEKDDEYESIEVRILNNGDYSDLLKIDSAYFTKWDSVLHSCVLQMTIYPDNNFYIRNDHDSDLLHTGEIVCVGNVKNIRKINHIPQSGWTDIIAVQPGKGYIIRNMSREDNEFYEFLPFCRYARVYVEDWIISTSGGIIGATIRYQDNWK